MIITTVNYYNECEFEPDFGLACDIETHVGRIIECVCDELGCEYETECSLLITSQDDIRELNLLHRGIDSVTDVLSFPAIDFEYPCGFDIINEDDLSLFNPESGELILGDIVICYDRVISQAKEYGHSVMREFSFLLVHSMLHLFGYDHIEDEDRVIMEDEQKAILDILNITR